MDSSLDDDNLQRLLHLLNPDRPPTPFPEAWSPPPDPDRPVVPYMPGFKVQIQTHAAPPPFGDERLYGPWPRRHISDTELETTTQSALVVSHPPLETTAPPDTRIETAQLAITSYIRIGCAARAQLVLCTLTRDDGEPPIEVVAKVFDALYYRFSYELAPRPRDVVAEADKDYAAEAAAYEQLASAGATGQFAPKYYGSWTFRLPITSKGQSQMRPVRLVLIERLQGANLQDLQIQNSTGLQDGPDAFHLTEDYRLEVLARAMDAWVRALHCGVNQGDFAARNVMVAPAKAASTAVPVYGASISRVVLIDYNTAVVDSCTLQGRSTERDLARPVNPMQWFWRQAISGDFSGWVPAEWEGSYNLMREWLTRRFGSEEVRALYEPVTLELRFDED